jgi:TonB family protein
MPASRLVFRRNEKIILMRFKIFILSIFISAIGYSQYAHYSIYGGKQEWKRFMQDHLVYPQQDLKDKTEGIVVISFEINRDGKGLNFKVTQSVTKDIDKEAMRLLSLIEKFSPNPEAVLENDKQSLEINFSVSKYKKWVKERGFEKRLFTDIPADTSLAVYERAEQGAAFFDKEKTFPEFVYSNLVYPDPAKRQNIEGNIIMSFIIEPDGMVSNIYIKNGGLGGGCTEEAIRVIGLTKWQPAVKEGKYVRFRMSYTMTFSIKNSFKDNSSGSQRTWGQ